MEAIGNHDHVIVNRLKVEGVKREHLNSTYKCQASNTKLMMPVERTVRLELLREYRFPVRDKYLNQCGLKFV